jgi:hypothetical protein
MTVRTHREWRDGWTAVSEHVVRAIGGRAIARSDHRASSGSLIGMTTAVKLRAAALVYGAVPTFEECLASVHANAAVL